MDHRFPNPVSRRMMLQRSGMGLGGLGLAGLLGAQAEDALAGEADTGSLRVRPPHFGARAKHVIHFFLNGGPSHVDTFDPKPMLARHAGKALGETFTTERKTGAAFPSPFKFQRYGESGLEISELFAKTAKFADDIAVIRSDTWS